MATSQVTPAARVLARILCLCLMISACEAEDALQVPKAASLDGDDRAGDVAASEARGDAESASESDARGTEAESTSATCDHVISPNVEEADGASNFSDVAPGDTVCISAGTRDPLVLRDFHGADGRAITFVNDGGTVTIRGDGGDYAGIEIEDSDHIRVTGSGVAHQCGAGVAGAAQRCGIRVLGAARGLTGKVRTEHLRVDHVEIGDTTQSAVSIKDNAMGRDEWVERDIVLDHNYVHDVHDEGFYIGSSDYESGEYHVLHGVHLAHNLVARTGRDGLQVGSATRDCTIHHNVIRETGRRDESSHRAGVMNNKGSVCNIYNNIISDTAGWGIYVQGNGGNEIYNNVVVRAGRFVDPGDNDGDGISVREGSNVGRGVRVWSNTIVSARGDGIGWHSDVRADDQIRNNIVVASGGLNIDGDSNVETADNLVADSVSSVKFLDEAGDDYRLSAASPAIDSGGSLTTLGVTDDIHGIARPQGGAYDIGAHERPAG